MKTSVPAHTEGLKHGHKLVGTTRVRLTELDLSPYRGVMLRCPGSSDPNGGNEAPVWFGGPRVTANSSEGTGGFPLIPGAHVTIPIEAVKDIYLISSSPNQDVAWVAI